jgi:hypothetical protein
MNAVPKWSIAPISKIEDIGISMKNRYSMSLSIYEAFPEHTFHYDNLERDGLGVWNIISFESSSDGFIMFGSATKENHSDGASVWTSADYSLDKATEIIRALVPHQQISIISSE